jgi:hypothetical protein
MTNSMNQFPRDLALPTLHELLKYALDSAHRNLQSASDDSLDYADAALDLIAEINSLHIDSFIMTETDIPTDYAFDAATEFLTAFMNCANSERCFHSLAYDAPIPAELESRMIYDDTNCPIFN